MQKHLEDYESPEKLWGFINDDGEIQIKAQFDDVGYFKDGLAPVNIKGMWGYVNKQGKVVIPADYMRAHVFDNGIARVRNADGLVGLIDIHGDTILSPRYEEIFSRKGHFHVISTKGKQGVINQTGKLVLEPLYKGVKIVHDSLFALKHLLNYQLVNQNLNPLQNDIESIKEGGLLRKEKGWGLIDKFGNWILQPKEEKLALGHPGHVVVFRDGKYFILNIHNGASFSIEARKLKYLGQNRYAKKKVNGWQLIDPEGIPVQQMTFSSIYAFSEGIAAYEVDDWWGYIDLNGKIITEPVFALPWTCSEGKLRLFTREGFGFHNAQGRLLIEPTFKDVRDFSEGMAAFQEF